MFAGLPGIGVGTLFYVLIALVMPVVEVVRVVQGTSSLARWRLVIRQWCFAVSIVISIMLAERVLMWILGTRIDSFNPAQLLNRELLLRSPQSLLAAPMTASLLVLVGILLTVEIVRVFMYIWHGRREVDIAQGKSAPVAASSPLKQIKAHIDRPHGVAGLGALLKSHRLNTHGADADRGFDDVLNSPQDSRSF